MNGELNPLCPDGGGHFPHTLTIEVTQGQARVTNGKHPAVYRLMALDDGRYVTDCDGYTPEPIPFAGSAS